MQIHCCSCDKKVVARLTNGVEIYPHRPDLAKLPFWTCDSCGSYVGCHHKTRSRIRPLGCMPTSEIRNARRHLHELIDPIWQSGVISRTKLYKMITNKIGWKYHTANIRSIEEARDIYRAVRRIKEEL